MGKKGWVILGAAILLGLAPVLWCEEAVAELQSSGKVKICGTLTHFHSADADESATAEQWQRFDEALEYYNTVLSDLDKQLPNMLINRPAVGCAKSRLCGRHDAVADQAAHPGAQNPGRNQVEYGLLALDDQRMAGVVATLEAHHCRGPVGQQIDDLALALITPLGTDYNYVLTHLCSTLSVKYRQLPDHTTF